MGTLLRDWWRSLEGAPEPLTGRQWGALAGATVVAAVSRALALARTPWDWDEMLFMLSLDRFDVARHHPHPPGFPLYVLSAKIIRKLGFDDFHALQALSLIGAMAIVPAMFFLCRELRMRFWASLSAAMLLAFFPNVWFYGGGAFSDVPSMTLMVVAAALLLAGCRNERAYLGGAAMLAIAAGFRPQNLVIGLAPFLIASTFRRNRIIHAIAIMTIVTGLSYGFAAWLTGWGEYRYALQVHRAYIIRVDSFLSPIRPPLWRVFDDFFVMPYHAPVINAIVGVLALIGILRRRPPVVVALAAFGPLCIFSWLLLDHYSASRFSIGYAPLIAILVADAFTTEKTERTKVSVLFVLSVVIYMAIWTWPALTEVRETISPPVAAVDWIRNHADPRTSTIYVETGVAPFADWYLRDYRLRFVGELEPPPTWTHRQPGYYLRENYSPSSRSVNFMRPHGRLYDVVRQRYFEVSVRPIEEVIAFGKGWYWEEGAGAEVWRWMGAHSEALLPPISGDARLSLSLYVPLDALPAPPNIVVRVNGEVVDQFRAGGLQFLKREAVVRARADGPNVLTIDTDRVVVPAAKNLSPDARTLGLRLNSIGWMPAR